MATVYQVSKLTLYFLEDQGREAFPEALFSSHIQRFPLPYDVNNLSFSFLIGFED